MNLGYYVGEDHLVVRRGFWRRRTTVIPYYRIQTVSTRRSIFQRRLGLASLVIDTASSRTFYWATPTIYDIDLEDAREANGSVERVCSRRFGNGRSLTTSDSPSISPETVCRPSVPVGTRPVLQTHRRPVQ